MCKGGRNARKTTGVALAAGRLDEPLLELGGGRQGGAARAVAPVVIVATVGGLFNLRRMHGPVGTLSLPRATKRKPP